MNLEVTPVLLTLDEAPNLARTLARLAWAREVLVVDSGSADATLDIARGAGNVRVVHHAFRHPAEQWHFAVHGAGVSTPWVLTLDADYVLDDALLAALEALPADPPAAAYRAAFTYCVHGRPLRGSLYPPRTVLFRRDRARFERRGHTQALTVDGPVAWLAGRILHDDRKPLERWLRSQWRYARDEAAHIAATPWRSLPWSGRARKLVLPAPPLAFVAALLWRGAVLDGAAGWHYALQRLVAEGLIAIALLERTLARDRGC